MRPELQGAPEVGSAEPAPPDSGVQTSGGSTARREELAARLSAVRRRIERACESAGRHPTELTLVAVTKFFPASDVDLLAELGVRAIGENRDQEAWAKLSEVARRDELEVHFIGQLQTNKASSVVRYADVVQSVDRLKLVGALDRAAAARRVRPQVLVQVNLEEATGRGGVDPRTAPRLAAQVAACANLRLRGVMAVAPLGADPAPAFATLRTVADVIRQVHPDAGWISAGMSGDLEAAIAHGATHLRVGSAILGTRQPHR
ncbi:YggS family pyridoxal phosphate-dependent enzyme [Pedococcus sp. 5OH_020]|uniref:YggS family pyridoxal phosphate-dependent enzyme n=1 Tax=Pedococcus sp. 5OH_020 TaxID=2989814 RepID=UPI0022EA0D78|nr:YggS family pyridoxal phosphate-dependent enzyme [Pedococcus sp. 5OH_020]